MRSIDSDTQAFKTFLADQGLTIFNEQSIDHGYQIIVTDGLSRNHVNFYKTGRILVQGKDSVLKTKLTEWTNLRQAGADQSQQETAVSKQLGPISRNSRYTVSPAKFDAIREEVIDQLNAIISPKPTAQSAEVYRVEVQRDSERVTVTQFQTGTLFVQGRSSLLFDEVCEALDQRLMQSFADRAIRYLPEETATSARQYLESPTAENDAWVWVRKELRQDVFDFLWAHDQQTIVSGAGILLALQETGRHLAEFSPVVMPFGKTFEGFVIRLSIHLGLVTEDAIKQSAETIKIGEWLGEIRDRLPDRRRYDFVAASLNSAWQSRNKCMHADPEKPMPICSLEEAIQEINSILRGMQKAHGVFLSQDIRLKSKGKSDAKVDIKPASASVTEQVIKSDYSLANSQRKQFEDVDIERLAAHIEADGYGIERHRSDHSTIWEVRTDTVQVFCSAKRPGRVTVQGRNAQDFVVRYSAHLQPSSAIAPRVTTEELFPESDQMLPMGRIGVDESGKGDVFGPLVVAGVFVQSEQEEALIRIGVRDSKTLSDTAIAKLSSQIMETCPQYVVAVDEPREYNVLYERLQNLNLLLAQKHADIIVQLHATTAARRAISDQFGNKSLVRDALKDRAGAIELVQRPHAEDDVAVAAASILARAAFVAWLVRASQTLGFQLPPGVAAVTIQAGRRLVEERGRKALAQYAKLHFRTVREML